MLILITTNDMYRIGLFSNFHSLSPLATTSHKQRSGT